MIDYNDLKNHYDSVIDRKNIKKIIKKAKRIDRRVRIKKWFKRKRL